MTPAAPIRLLAFDASPEAGQGLRGLLKQAPDISLIGVARRPAEMLEMARTLKPNLMTVSTEAATSTAVEVARTLMEQAPGPIVMLASDRVATQVTAALQAMDAGALAVIPPAAGRDPKGDARALATLRAMAGMKVVRRWRPAAPGVRVTAGKSAGVPATLPAGLSAVRRARVVAIAASTGGPAVLHRIFARLPADLAAPILVVQHIARGFAAGLAEWLTGGTALPVELAKRGENLRDGVIYVADNDLHLGVSSRGTVLLSDDPPIEGFRPSANFLFKSVARFYGQHALGVVLTGMGEDGASGLVELSAAGGRVLAQDEASCVVFGMPAAAIKQGVASAVLTPDDIAAELVRFAGSKRQV
jgi:two-component system chemotaxis response regulator CheB